MKKVLFSAAILFAVGITISTSNNKINNNLSLDDISVMAMASEESGTSDCKYNDMVRFCLGTGDVCSDSAGFNGCD